MFLEYDWLVKHNLEVNQDKETMQFTKCLKKYKIQHQDIAFISRTKRIKPIKEINKEYQEIDKEPDLINLEDLPEYIQYFTHLFNKKLNAKVYTIIIKKEEALN